MRRFLEFLQDKEEEGLGDINIPQPEDGAILNALKHALSHHQDKVLQFLNTLAENDETIRKLIGKYKDMRNSYPPEHMRLGKDKEKDIIAMPNADMSEPI